MVVLPQTDRLIGLRGKAAQQRRTPRRFALSSALLISRQRPGVRRCRAAFSLCILLALAGCKQKATREVIVYASQDQVYAEPILSEFTRSTSIKVRAVYDSEAVKTVGLVNRLLREASNPQCDVFWNNEELRTRQLAARGILRETNAWVAVGYRSRRIVINTNLVPTAKAPSSFSSLTNAEWRGKIALAYPLFGSTATHFLALRQHWGPQRWESWCRALQTNKPLLLEGNSTVVNFVGRGEAWIGLTDSDDIAAGQRSGLPVAALPLNAESLLIPNTVALIRGSRNPGAADELSAFLQRPEILQRLIAVGALESAQAPKGGETLDWATLLNDLDSATDTLRAIFVR